MTSALALTSCPSENADSALGFIHSLVANQDLRAVVPSLRPHNARTSSLRESNETPAPGSVVSSAPAPSSAASASAAHTAAADVPETGGLAAEDAERVLVSIGRETWVYSEPKPYSKKLGYLRFGAVVGRAATPASRDDCAPGWYRISPDGYVCNNGRTATIDLEHRLAVMGRQRPDRLSGLPYVYGVPRDVAPPLYARVPTRDEQSSVEPSATQPRTPRDWSQFTLLPMPNWLRQNANVFGFPRDRSTLTVGSTVARSAFSLVGLFEDDGRAFGLTADLALVPLAKLKPVQASRFHGVPLDAQHGLPLAFAMRSGTGIYAGEIESGKLTFVRMADFREGLHLSGRHAKSLGSNWVQLQSGEWIRDEHLVHVDAPANWPSWAVAGRSWVDVSIGNQTLVAYDGTQPVYATLVSTGAAGLEDPHTTTATKRGTFQIRAKHVTSTMDSSEPGHEFDLRDVPWVQYFTEGYALHAAYWHDDFGHPRSHGCVNLSPLDARWLFHFTSPFVPQTWHGALASSGDATIVNVHP